MTSHTRYNGVEIRVANRDSLQNLRLWNDQFKTNNASSSSSSSSSASNATNDVVELTVTEALEKVDNLQLKIFPKRKNGKSFKREKDIQTNRVVKKTKKPSALKLYDVWLTVYYNEDINAAVDEIIAEDSLYDNQSISHDFHKETHSKKLGHNDCFYMVDFKEVGCVVVLVCLEGNVLN